MFTLWRNFPAHARVSSFGNRLNIINTHCLLAFYNSVFDAFVSSLLLLTSRNSHFAFHTLCVIWHLLRLFWLSVAKPLYFLPCCSSPSNHLSALDEEDILLYGEVIDVCKKERSAATKPMDQSESGLLADSAIEYVRITHFGLWVLRCLGHSDA